MIHRTETHYATCSEGRGCLSLIVHLTTSIDRGFNGTYGRYAGTPYFWKEVAP